jgi:hypothetical protein
MGDAENREGVGGDVFEMRKTPIGSTVLKIWIEMCDV